MGVGAEGWFAFPSPDALASKLFPEVTEPKERMCRLVNFALDKLERSRSFKNWRKQVLKVKHYARYTDDFVIVSKDKGYLEDLIDPIRDFLKENLELDLHPNKVTIRKNIQGVDFLGYVSLPHCRLMRRRTKKRIFRKLEGKIRDFKAGVVTEQHIEQSLQSYLGGLSHADAHKVSERLKNQFWFWMDQ
jgi:hypothetical protein